MEKLICIHGHFYQPPRENPWTGGIERQPSAAPYHDWNERILAECYRSNMASRTVDGDNCILRLRNNYRSISFNFGPTLLSWMEAAAPDVYAAILEADSQSRGDFGGHGSAIAQAYNHMIMPLADDRDRLTQIVWGIADFSYRFQRPPEGMWLPETAVSTAVLEDVAAAGIRFVILAPRQIAKVRRRGDRIWSDTRDGSVDSSQAYSIQLPSGRSIAVFPYNGAIAQAVAFDGLLRDGESFARRLLESEPKERRAATLIHIATDGETYGHHHPFGDMALAAALDYCVRQPGVHISNYGLFLERHPPQFEAEIVENSSWSCAHGVERWRSDCGCNAGSRPEWRQSWRGPLRAALNWLRDRLAKGFEAQASTIFYRPWVARNAYIRLVLDDSGNLRTEFARRHLQHPQADLEPSLQLLEMQRFAMLMFTSCGWFFDEISGLEGVQILQYAARAIQLAQAALRLDLEEPFLKRLELAPSNLPQYLNGRGVYEKLVRPSMFHTASPPQNPSKSPLLTAAERFQNTRSARDLRTWTSLAIANEDPSGLDVWKSQNILYRVLQEEYFRRSEAYRRQFRLLARVLSVRVPDSPEPQLKG